jgi:excinuclease ABC subunit C
MPRADFTPEAVGKIPTESGVYQFVDEAGKVIYVGKAVDLRSRVRQYLNQTDQRPFVAHIARCATSIEFVATGSVKDALLLENSLIKQHAPRFNIRLRDDKTYFSLKLDLKAEWPRLVIVRRRKKEDVLYFGPYTSAQACRRTIQYLNSLFPIRTCPDSVLYNRTRPCLNHEIGRCVAPCVAGHTTPDEYRAVLDRVVRFLSGHDREVLAEVEAEMKAAAMRMDYERAAELRDRLAAMRTTVERPVVARRGGRDRDVIGMFDAGTSVAVAVLHVRDGVLAHTDHFTLKRLGEPSEILGSFLGQYYGGERPLPPEILLEAECDDLDLYREALRGRGGERVDLVIPERGEGLRLVRIAARNAELSHREGEEAEEQGLETLDRLQEALRLVNPPRRIECYDISHLAGTEVVGSGVAFVLGKPAKALYRHYRLRDVQRNDDFAALGEVLGRRLRRGLAEGDLPDLVIVDGGRPQVLRAVQTFRELKVSGVDLIGLAKARPDHGRGGLISFERVVPAEGDDPIILRPDSAELLLLMRIRDEAHRFAIQYNRRLRRKAAVSSVLELIPGIGARRARALLAHFGSLPAVKSAPIEALAAAPGMTTPAAAAIRQFFDEHRDAGVDRGGTSIA